VVQAEAWGVASRFGLIASATTNIVEEREADICSIEDMFVFLAETSRREQTRGASQSSQ
jgi:Holliday junction resolvasome RuvABC endonuclease subunit